MTPAHGVAGFFERNRFLIVFAALAVLMGTSVGLARIATSLYALDLHASGSLLGLISGGQVVGILVMSLPIGFLVDHFGPARLFVTGSALAGITYALIPVVQSPLFLLGCTIAISFFMPLRFVSLNTIFFQQLQSLGTGKAGWYRGTHMSGMFLIGPLIAPWLIAHFNFSGSFWLIALSFAITILICPIVFARYAARPKNAAPNTGRHSGVAELRAQLAYLARDAELREANLIDFFAQAANNYFSFFVIVIAIEQMHLSAAAASGLVTMMGASFILAVFVLGNVVQRLGQYKSYLVGFALMAGGLLLLGLAKTSLLLWPGALLLGFGEGLVQIANISRLARIGQRLGQGKVSGLNMLIGPAGAFAGSLLGGFVGSYLGLQPIFLLLIPAFAYLAWRLIAHPISA